MLQDVSLYSTDGRTHVVPQDNGDLAVYGPSGFSWDSGTSGTNRLYSLVLQEVSISSFPLLLA